MTNVRGAELSLAIYGNSISLLPREVLSSFDELPPPLPHALSTMAKAIVANRPKSFKLL